MWRAMTIASILHDGLVAKGRRTLQRAILLLPLAFALSARERLEKVPGGQVRPGDRDVRGLRHEGNEFAFRTGDTTCRV
jgi:hypothetical protein